MSRDVDVDVDAVVHDLYERLPVVGAVVVLIKDRGDHLDIELAWRSGGHEAGPLTERIGLAVQRAVREHGDACGKRVIQPIEILGIEDPS